MANVLAKNSYMIKFQVSIYLKYRINTV